jgi:hypothetical protein
MRNKFPGTCYECKEPVAAGAGHPEKAKNSPGRWYVKCAGCAIKNKERKELEKYNPHLRAKN